MREPFKRLGPFMTTLLVMLLLLWAPAELTRLIVFYAATYETIRPSWLPLWGEITIIWGGFALAMLIVIRVQLWRKGEE